MPAPDRIGSVQSFNNVLKPLKGIVGHYSDLEVDELLAGLSGGTLQTVDLSAYATTAYVDGELAKVYDKAGVDAAIAAAIVGVVTGGTVDLNGYATEQFVTDAIAAIPPASLDGYATTDQLDATKTEIITAATTALQERYTKKEVDALFVPKTDQVAPVSLDGYATEQYVDDSISRINGPALVEGVSISPMVVMAGAGGVVFESAYRLTVENVGIGPRAVIETSNIGVVTRLVCLTREDAYTKAEVDAKLPDITAEIIVSAIKDADIEPSNVRVGTVYLTSVAMAGRDGRIVTANESGKMEQVALLSDLEAVSAPDLTAYAKTVDNTQNLVANATVAQGYTFGDSISPNNPGLVYADTGEGYGPRLVLDTPTGKELIPYQSDFEPIKARMDALENKQAPAAMDMSAFAKLADANQTIVAGVVEANRFRIDATRSLILLVSGGQERLVYKDGAKNNALAFVSELAGLCTIADAATQIAACAKKEDTYTKTDCDTKFLTTVDIDRFPFRVEVEDTFKKYVSVNFLMTIFAANYFTKPEADSRFVLKGETAAQTLQGVDVNDPNLAAFKASVMAEVRSMMAGGKTVPADIDWTPCTKVAGSGLIEARVLNGLIQLRGELALTVTGMGSFVVAQRLPANFPKPPRDQTVVAFGYESGVTYRRVFVRFYANGDIGIVGDGKITGTELTGAQAYAY